MKPENIGSDFDDFLKEENILEDTEKVAILRNFARRMVESQEDLKPEFAKIMNEKFWDLI